MNWKTAYVVIDGEDYENPVCYIAGSEEEAEKYIQEELRDPDMLYHRIDELGINLDDFMD